MSAASRLGLADANVITLTEQVDFARHCAFSVDVPVLVDADNGYGNATNDVRTVREFEQSGVAAIVIEDQVVPKRCGLFPGVRPIVEVDEMVGKFQVAMDARQDSSFMIIARTDSFGARLSVEEAPDKAGSYGEAGTASIIPISKKWENLERFGQKANL
jgi:2,3-dimethylmalate lyase